MRAAVTQAPNGAVSIEDVDDPQRRSGWLVVDLAMSLVAQIDRATYADGGDELFPLSQGAGGVGVLATGGASAIVGSRVAIWPRLACGRCAMCSQGRRDECLDATTLGRDRSGTLAEQVLVPRDNAVLLPSAVSPEVAAAAIEYADAWRLLAEAGAAAGRRVAIVGSTSTTAATRRVASAMGANVVDLAADGDFDAIIAAGSRVASVVDRLAPGGTLVISEPELGDTALIDGAAVVLKRVRVVGARPGGRQDFVEVLRWIAEEGFRPPIGQPVSLDSAGQAFGGDTEPIPVVID